MAQNQLHAHVFMANTLQWRVLPSAGSGPEGCYAPVARSSLSRHAFFPLQAVVLKDNTLQSHVLPSAGSGPEGCSMAAPSLSASPLIRPNSCSVDTEGWSSSPSSMSLKALIRFTLLILNSCFFSSFKKIIFTWINQCYLKEIVLNKTV